MPEIEIVRDPHEEAANTFTMLGPAHEIVPSHWYWLSVVRGWVPDSRLFVYRHRETNRFVLAVWVFDPTETSNPVFMELETFASPPNYGWPADLLAPEVLRARLRPAHDTVSEIRRKATDARHAERHGLEEDERHKADVCKSLRRMGKDREAWLLETGQLPFAGVGTAGQAALDETAETLRTLARIT